MTIVEFYDQASIENIAGSLLCRPEQVILIGNKRKQLQRATTRYRCVLERNGIKTEISYRSVNKNHLAQIVTVLEQIADSCEDCIFDLTGGDEMYLVAVGQMLERYSGRIQCHRFGFRSETLQDCDADGSVCRSESFDISVEDNVSIYAGEIVTDRNRESFTYPWRLDEELERDVDAMWEICRRNVRLWNAHVSTLGTICEQLDRQDALSVSFDQSHAASLLSRRGDKYTFVASLMYDLQKNGLIQDLQIADTVSFAFKNEEILRCLTVAGQILELVIAKTMRQITDRDGSRLYHDVKVGVVIDWDPVDEEEQRTINEIDVLAMKGCIPIFISCKNGDFDAGELYKLSTVADRFGGKYAKKVLISTSLDRLGEKADYLRARMEDMGIRCVENVDEMSGEELTRVLRSLWCN